MTKLVLHARLFACAFAMSLAALAIDASGEDIATAAHDAGKHFERGVALYRETDYLAALVEFIFLERPGYQVRAQPEIPGLRLHRCDGHLLAISSTELRQRCRAGLSLDYFVPHKAILYIGEKGLYRDPT